MKEICKYLTVCAVCSCLVKLACVFKGREKMPGEYTFETKTEKNTTSNEPEFESDEIEK